MSLTPLLAAPLPVQIHAISAIAALTLGLFQLLGPRLPALHRLLGRGWAALMLATATSAIFITGRDGRYSATHLLVPVVFVMLWQGVLAARRHQLLRHRLIITSLFIGALVVAGGFALSPGRLMHAVVFGAPPSAPGASALAFPHDPAPL